MGRSWLSGGGQPKKRDCFAGSPLSVIARDEAISVVNPPVIARNVAISVVNLPVIARNVAISPFLCQQTEKREIASQARLYLSSRGTWRSRLSSASKQRQERLLRRLAMTGCVIARNAAISPFRSRQTEKREIASQARLYLSSRGTWRSRLS